MNNIKAIINGKLQPWQPKTNLSEDFYSPELRKLHSVNEDFTAQYKINFSIVPFSVKIKYYQKLIDIEIVKYINSIIEETTGGSENLVVFKLDKAKKKLRNLLVEVSSIIERKQFDFTVIASKYADFKNDRNHKESTYIFHYMLIALVRCWLEIQSRFIGFMHKEDVLTIADIYSQILQKAVPENLQIQEIQTIQLKTDKPTIPQPIEKEEAFAIQYAQEKYTVFMDEVKPFRFIELQKLSALNQQSKNRLIKELVENPLHYSVAMLSFLGYLESLKKGYSLSKEKIYSHIAKALQTDVRTVKGNCLVLNPASKEDRYKYQADQFVKKVEDDYNLILSGKLLK